MQIRNVVAVGAIALALLVPAGVAHADPTRTATVFASEPVLYPAPDGYIDTTVISGAVTSTSGTERIRGSVIVTAPGGRVAKSWTLSSTGAFSYEWNGRVGSSIVAGTYRVTVRVDGLAPVTPATFVVSAKKITKLTYTKSASVIGDIGFECIDDKNYPFDDPRFSRHQLDICPLNFVTNITFSGKKASGLFYIRHVFTLPSAIYHSLGPVSASVTGTFTQYGPGSNTMWVCSDASSDEGCDTPRIVSWSGSATQTAAASLGSPESNGMQDLSWWVRISGEHDLTVRGPRYSVKITYYGLR